MDPIFLTPDVTFSVSIKTKFDKNDRPVFAIKDGGPYKIRTATGREFHAIQTAVGRADVDAAYALCQTFVQGGIADELKGDERTAIFDRLHPDVAWAIVLEVAKRSRASELDRGK